MLDYSRSFIETQFPVSKISKESYKERVAGASQTLTGLGKWWGRKPLILVRATVLGILLPVSDNPGKDREIFQKILTIDEGGLILRKTKNISTKEVYYKLNKIEQEKYFILDGKEKVPGFLKSVTKEEKEYLQKLVFNRLSYDNKLDYCERPENIKIEDLKVWDEINNHLKTNAFTIEDLVKQLGKIRFGHNPKIGDCFAGGGSIPFESARLGADIYASDLNPMACLLTWASLNIAGAKDEVKKKINIARKEVLTKILMTIEEWDIEKNELGHYANSYIYCNEATCDACKYKVPLATSWIISGGVNAIAILKDNNNKGYEIEIIEGATKEQMLKAKDYITVKKNKMCCPHCGMETPITSLRGDKKDKDGGNVSGLRKWGENEYISRKEDIFQERLYAIRYSSANGRYYTSPSGNDLEREQKVKQLLSQRFLGWQEEGILPSEAIENGYNTDQPMRERGWQYWHQLFNPRQLLVLGLINSAVSEIEDKSVRVALSLSLNKFTDWNSRLSIWNSGAGSECVQNTFSNQALNTLYNYGTRSANSLKTGTIWHYNMTDFAIEVESKVEAIDARKITEVCDIFITDPPYADAVNYHELTEFFLPWNKKLIEEVFPEWYTDSKRVLAVKGVGKTFNESMIEIYKNLANHMPDNGYQVVMFTHQDVKVWSELAMILWSAGLRVVSAWNVATETDSGGLKSGNYVKGTVLLTLKKQNSIEMAFQDDLYDEITQEVEKMIDSMRSIDDKDDPDFLDADYLLASYASSLKVLTKYKKIEGIDVQYWLSQPRESKEENPVEKLINKAVRIAYDYLIPEGFNKHHWTDLKPEERFFIRGLELEMNGSYKMGSYQELAMGFGVSDYKDMFADFKANAARLKTPGEYNMAFLNGRGFGSTITRHLLVAISETIKTQSTVEGRSYLRNVFADGNEYWYKKPLMTEILSFIANLAFVDHMEQWKEAAYAAKILKESLKNEGV